MSDSSLIVFLPLIGAILGAVVGGFVGAYANSWYRDREAKKARDQELKGLTLLLFTEVGHNEALLKMHEGHPNTEHIFPLTGLKTDIWVSSRVRLAQLLTNEHTSALVSYYRTINDILETVNNGALHDEIKTKFILQDAEKAQKYGRAAMMQCGKYMFVDYPEYTEDKHAAFVEESRKLMD